ncbi:MAG: glycerol-3-phosphate acyltransferase, partial [Phycisphaerales bacterium]
VLGKRYGLICFALDVLKGAGPVVLAGAIMGTLGQPAHELTNAEQWWWLAVAMATVFGHMFPIYIGFKGGKGVATGFGALAGMWAVLTLPAILAIVTWYAMLKLTRYVSVASMGAAAAIPLLLCVLTILQSDDAIGPALAAAHPPLIVTTALALLVIYKHRTNIARLRRGEEPKSGTAPRVESASSKN